MSVPLRALTIKTSLCTCKYSQVYNFQITYFCIQTQCVQPHICLCPCKCTHFEPLCIHAYIHKYTCIVWRALLYKNPRCGNSHMSMPLRALAVRTSLCACKYSEVCIFQITDAFVYKPHCVQPHICLCPCECSQLEPFCLHANTHKYTSFKSQILLYTNPMCATSHMSVPLQVHTLRTSL